MSASSSGTPVSRMMVPNQQLESQFVQHQPSQQHQDHRENNLSSSQQQYLLNLQETQHLPQNVHRQYITSQPRNNINVPRLSSNGDDATNVVQTYLSNINVMPSSNSSELYTSGKSNGSGQQTVITNVNYLSLPIRNTDNTSNSTANIPNPSNQAPPHNMQFVKKPTVNVAAGWKRILENNEIIYVSPTGVSLKSHTQIKQYLLTPGTCKCGLPCPLRPEYFFEFNSQVPNTPLKLALNGEQIKSLPCVHQRRVMENSLFLQNDVRRRKNVASLDNKFSQPHQVQPPGNTLSTYTATSQILDKQQPTTNNLSDAVIFSKPQIWRKKSQNFMSQYHIPPSIAQNQTLIQSNERVPAWHPETHSQPEEEIQSVINNKEKYIDEAFDDHQTENDCYVPSSQSPHLEELMDEEQEEEDDEEHEEGDEEEEEVEEEHDSNHVTNNGHVEPLSQSFRPQQHLQLQQQIQQHNNLLYRKSNQTQNLLNQKKTFLSPTQKSYIRYQTPIEHDLRNMTKVMKSTSYQTLPRNTITSVQAGKSNTTTTSVSFKEQRPIIGGNNSAPVRMEPASRHFIQQKPTSIQFQPPMRNENNSQLIVTSTGQILVMSNQNSSSTSKSQIIQQAQPQHSSGQVVFQRTSTNTFTQSQGNTNGTTLVLNNGQNLITSPASSIITPSGTKVITNNQQLGLISPNHQHQQLVSQQTVVLNTVPNSYVLQPNNQVVTQIMNNQEIIHQNQPQIILSPTDLSKRKAKKRKNSTSSSPSITPTSLSPQSPIHSQQHQQIVQIQTAPQYTTQQQSFQMSPGIPGIVLNKNGSQNSQGVQQQFILQNGQLVQPVNLIGQQVLVQGGLMMAPQTDTHLLQIQNVNMGSNIITTPQGMVIRAQSPQNKAFLSPNAAGSSVQQGQQYIVGSNGQLSPINQIYTTQMGLMMPSQSQHATTTFMQQNTTIVPQQQQSQTIQTQPQVLTIMKPQQQMHLLQDIQQSNHHQTQVETNSPPDTTTHSPRSPERPISQRSGGSDMVVSSSEPDSMVSPTISEHDNNIQHYSLSPEKGMIHSGATKIRRIQYEPQNQHVMDKESSPNKPKTTTSPTTTTPKPRGRPPTISLGTSLSRTTAVSTACTSFSSHPNYSPGELVWGSARGHPAWPGKIVNSPDGTSTPNDSAWVQWFGGRPHVELVSIQTLKTLSEGLDAHHKAQKDTRKGRKLNNQLERAIHEAMLELDRNTNQAVAASQSPQSTPSNSTYLQKPNAQCSLSPPKPRGRKPQMPVTYQRSKPIKIAPAPPLPMSSIIVTNPSTTTTISK